MPERIGYAGSVAVVDGPTINFNSELQVGEYEKHTITVAPAGGKGTISLGSTADIQLIAAVSSLYSKDLTFTADPDKTDRPFNQPLVMAGGMFGIVDIAKVTAFTFTNNIPGTPAPDVTISVLIARTA